jgi:hypothetical protein
MKCKTPNCETTMSEGAPEYCPVCQEARASAAKTISAYDRDLTESNKQRDLWKQCAETLARDVQFLLGEIQAVKNTGEDGVYTATSIMMELFRRYPDGYSEALDHFTQLKK